MPATLAFFTALVFAPACCAAGMERPLDPSELARILRAHIAQTVRCKEADVEIRSTGRTDGVTVPADEIAFRIREKSVPATYRNRLVGIEVIARDKTVRSLWVKIDASVQGSFARIKRRVPYGAALAPEDFDMVQAEIPDLRDHYFHSAEEVVGLIARRLLLPGDAVSAGVVVPPYLVRNGQTVRLRVERDGVTIAALVRAEQDGRLGESVAVRNLDFSRRLKARVVGPGAVTID